MRRRSWWGPIGYLLLNLLLLGAWVAVQVQTHQAARHREATPAPAVSRPADSPGAQVSLAQMPPLSAERPRSGG